jgi:hypothetical protein
VLSNRPYDGVEAGSTRACTGGRRLAVTAIGADGTVYQAVAETNGRVEAGCPRPLPEALDRCPAVQRDYLLGLAGPVQEGWQIGPGVPGQPPVFDHAGR